MNLFQMIDMNLTSAEEVRISIRKASNGVLCVGMSVVQTEGTQEIVAMNTHRSTPEQMESSSCWDDMHLMLILANEAMADTLPPKRCANIATILLSAKFYPKKIDFHSQTIKKRVSNIAVGHPPYHTYI